jgi:hypothetical protein
MELKKEFIFSITAHRRTKIEGSKIVTKKGLNLCLWKILSS